MVALREVVYVKDVPRNTTAVLAADIGGTNSNFGIFAPGRDDLLFSLHAKSQDVYKFTDLVQEIITYCEQRYQLTIHNACFAAAGVVSQGRTHCKPTNLDFMIDTQDIIAKTSLKCIFLVNDFTVIGYGMQCIDPKSVVQVKEGSLLEYENKVILGAGTGLGKSIMWWDASIKRFVPLASEGGHADFAAHTEQELRLMQFIKQAEGWECSVSWEDVLSGNGIKRLYAFFRSTHSEAKANDDLVHNGIHPDEIFNNRTLDDHAWRTYQCYARFYARCAKNLALDGLARGGVYIAGGIASHNLELFQQHDFLNEFVNCGKQQELLRDIPIYVISDYNVSLYGALEYLRLVGYCK